MEFEAVDEFENVRVLGVDGAREWAQELTEATAAARAAIEQLEQLPAGEELLSGLMASKPLFCDTPLAIRRNALWTKVKSFVEAQIIEAHAEAATSVTNDDLRRAVVIDTAKLTNQSEHSVARQFTLMQRVAEKYNEAWAALNAGKITFSHLLSLDDVLRSAKPVPARAVESQVIAKAIDRGWQPAQLKDAARRALIAIDPLGAEQRARRAKETESGVSLRSEEDQMALLSARGDAWTARQMMDEINRRADELGREGDTRGLGQRQIDALASALLGAQPLADITSRPSAHATDKGETDTSRPRQPKRATALLILTLETLLGGDQPARLEGYGPITADLARRIAADDIDFRRLLIDPVTGKPIDLGMTSYRPSAAMRRYIEAVDRTCRVRGCTLAASFCDIDHGVEWPDGPTSCDNCGLLCRRHHGVKTKKIYTLRRDDERNVTFISPFGFEWQLDAASYEEFLPDEAIAATAGRDPDPPPDDVPLPPEPPPDDELLLAS